MGIRQVLVSPDVLIAFLKAHDGAKRTYTVEKPLPDDIQLKDWHVRLDGLMCLLVESQEWIGDGHDIVLPPPEIRVSYVEET